MSATMSREKLLSNYRNKQRLINMLCVKIQKEDFVVKQAEEDADYLIIKSAFKIEKGSQCIAVGEIWCDIAPNIKDNILSLHAFSGFDTTSACFRPWKKKFINVLYSTKLQQVVNIFRDENSCPYDINGEGQKILISLYLNLFKNH
ncbi:hypothetical protein AVEN_64191-1 [Araneus ventricosus]|uniref:Uncharacterized protein n=1 Tax=Araneus ventricosus TaxID=182803 RepID=A0A4Y2QJD7_ARAVE|nr:hypothetical protein AVEN_64191-1 [Araneus ventricosus]